LISSNNNKYCGICRTLLPTTAFYPSRFTQDGFDNRCKECYRTYQRTHRKEINTRVSATRRNNKERHNTYVRRHAYRAKYGISLEKYEEMCKEQNGVCAICHKPESQKKRLAIDHDHETGLVRALLCNSCNAAIGFLQDDIGIASNALAYLTKYKNALNTGEEN